MRQVHPSCFHNRIRSFFKIPSICYDDRSTKPIRSHGQTPHICLTITCRMQIESINNIRYRFKWYLMFKCKNIDSLLLAIWKWTNSMLENWSNRDFAGRDRNSMCIKFMQTCILRNMVNCVYKMTNLISNWLNQLVWYLK